VDCLSDGWHGFASESGALNDEKTTPELLRPVCSALRDVAFSVMMSV
jgi:hypothetical protein